MIPQGGIEDLRYHFIMAFISCSTNPTQTLWNSNK